jgi:thioredoxin 1
LFIALGLAGILVVAYATGAFGPASHREPAPAATTQTGGHGTLAELTDKTFDEGTAKGVVLVDFWAPWCGPCRAQKPILDSMAATLPDGARIVQVNTDQNAKVAERFAVEALPTLVIFKDGKEARRFVGLQKAEALRSAIKALL